MNLNTIAKPVLCLSFVSLAQSNLFCFIFAGWHPSWSFYAPETGSASGTNKNKNVHAQKLSKRGTEHAGCTKDGLALPVMLFVNPLFGKIIFGNI